MIGIKIVEYLSGNCIFRIMKDYLIALTGLILVLAIYHKLNKIEK
jgi:hypothetical protein